MVRRPSGELRKGWTTGACAAAAAGAAYEALLTGRFPDPVTITLPRGQRPSFALAESRLGPGFAEAGVIKDAGDDPDATDGALVRVRVRGGARGGGVRFLAGEGVGTVTRPGLELGVGEPAINPAPRRLVCETVAEVARARGGSCDLEVTVSIPGGEAMAARTTNRRLGIVGGLSVLGTTGVVVPYSCASWIHSIQRGIDVARASGLDHLAAATGSVSEAAVQALYDLPEAALIDMGDLAGGVLKYLRKHPVARLTIAGGFAKLSKLAQGRLDLHSGQSRVGLGDLAAILGELGAEDRVQEAAAAANTAGQVLEVARQAGLGLGDEVARRARAVALETLNGGTEVEVVIYDRKARLVGRAPF